MIDTTRTPTEIDRIAEDYLDAWVELSPLTATCLGVAGRTAGSMT